MVHFSLISMSQHQLLIDYKKEYNGGNKNIKCFNRIFNVSSLAELSEMIDPTIFVFIVVSAIIKRSVVYQRILLGDAFHPNNNQRG